MKIEFSHSISLDKHFGLFSRWHTVNLCFSKEINALGKILICNNNQLCLETLLILPKKKTQCTKVFTLNSHYFVAKKIENGTQ